MEQQNTPNPARAEKIKQEKGFFARLEEWNAIEDMVMRYKKQFDETSTEEEKEDGKLAGGQLLEAFYPLFRKYLALIKSGQIDFNDKEMKRFVLGFVGDKALKTALKRDKTKHTSKHSILYCFNFVTETYGQLPEDVIKTDLQMLMLILAKRYKQMGRNFCSYVYNTYLFEVSRHIKKYIKNPSNIHYKNCEYEEYMASYTDPHFEETVLDKTYENAIGLPDSTWIGGENCGEEFAEFSPLERKILVMYYMEGHNDRQIGEILGLHINTINQKRRMAISKLAQKLDIDETSIKRNRNSGKNILGKLLV